MHHAPPIVIAIAIAIAIAGFLALGCRDRAPTCKAAAGTWHDADGRSYQLSSNPNGYEMVALFDTARAPGPASGKHPEGTRYAPEIFDLRIEAGSLRGRRAQRITRGATLCEDHRPVTGSCVDGRLRLSYGPATTCSEHGPMAPAATLQLAP